MGMKNSSAAGAAGPAVSEFGGKPMRTMLIGFAAAIGIAVVVGLVMYNINPGTDEQYSVAGSVRL